MMFGGGVVAAKTDQLTIRENRISVANQRGLNLECDHVVGQQNVMSSFMVVKDKQVIFTVGGGYTFFER